MQMCSGKQKHDGNIKQEKNSLFEHILEHNNFINNFQKEGLQNRKIGGRSRMTILEEIINTTGCQGYYGMKRTTENREEWSQ